MPFWYDWQKETYNEELNDNSMLSIDDKYDPEEGIEIKNFVIISRMLPYQENF